MTLTDTDKQNQIQAGPGPADEAAQAGAPRERFGLLERSVVAFATAALLIGAVALVPDPSRRGLLEDEFEQLRSTWKACADVVFLGDSRVLCGVSPQAMRERMGDVRIYNFAFAGTAFSEPIFDQARQVLDPRSKRPTLVLGMTPLTLATGHGAADPLAEARRKVQTAGLIERFADRLARPFQPRSVRTFRASLGFKSKRSSYKDFHEDGWMESDSQPNRPMREVVRFAEWFKIRIPPYDKSLAMLLPRVRQWRKEGIRVYAFRPPTWDGMIQLENKEGKFDEARVRQAFVEAGGVWLDARQTAYPTYDGSHLRYDGARDFSRDLAELILKAEQ